jgi:ABC-type branched-subunit amino acid transport system substrate-binding protein
MHPFRYRIGVMFSTTGPYSVVSNSLLNGTLLALEECAVEYPTVTLEPVIVNPDGRFGKYAELATELLKSGIHHVVGCYTSSSRKEVIPFFEKHDALLWYPTRYEGFETSNNVIYTGPSPNQHVLPLVGHMLATAGKRAVCVGSNYIWAWENTRVFREAMATNGGEVLAERYVPVGDIDLGQMIDAIIDAKPDFIFNNLIGTTAYAFFRQFRLACQARGIDQASAIPVASCTLSEPELLEIGEGFLDGHLSSSVYFSSLQNPANLAFTTAYEAQFPGGPVVSSDAEASYIAVKLLAGSLAVAGTQDIGAVKRAVLNQRLNAPQGKVRIDPETFHSWLTPRIGRSTTEGRFQVVFEEEAPTRPDPYLVQTSPRFAELSQSRNLKVVS